MASTGPSDTGKKVTECYEELVKTGSSELPNVVALFLKIVDNILNNPTEKKFRSLNAEKVVSRLTVVEGAVEMLTILGFVKTVENGSERYELPANASLAPLKAASYLFTHRYKPPHAHSTGSTAGAGAGSASSASTSTTTTSSSSHFSNKADLDEEEAAIHAEEAKKKKEREELRRRMEALKTDRQATPAMAVSSKASDLTFGSTLVKFKPPCPPKNMGGGGG